MKTCMSPGTPPWMAASPLPETLSTCGNLHLDNLVAADDPRAATLVALVLNDSPLAAAVGADALSLHHAEDGTLLTQDVAAAVTGRTCLHVAAAILGAAAMTVRTSHLLAHLEFLGDARGTLLQREAHLQPQVAATVLLSARTTASAAKTTKAAKAAAERGSAAEEVAEDVAELREDVVHRHVLVAAACGTADTGKAELVIALALLRVMQHVVGLCRLLELGFSFLLLGLGLIALTVGMVFDGHLLVGRLDFLFSRVLRDAQHLVVISLLFCHNVLLSLHPYCHFGITYDLIVEGIAFLHTVDDTAFLLVGYARHLSDGLMKIDVEVLALRIYRLDTQTGQCLQELLIDEFHALGHRSHVLGRLHRRQGTLQVVHDGQHCHDS